MDDILLEPIVDKILHHLPLEYVFYLGRTNKFWLNKCRRRVLDTRVLHNGSKLCYLWFTIDNGISPHMHDFLWGWFTKLLDCRVSVDFFVSYAHQLLHFVRVEGPDMLRMVVPEYRRRRCRRELNEFPIVHRAYAREPWIAWDRLIVYRAILPTRHPITLEKVQYMLEKMFDMRQLFVGDVVLASIYTNRLDILRWVASLSTRYAWIEPLLDKIARFVVEHTPVSIFISINSYRWLPLFVHDHTLSIKLSEPHKRYSEALRFMCQWVDMRRPINGEKLHQWILIECMTDATIIVPSPETSVMMTNVLRIRSTLYAFMQKHAANSRVLYWMTRYSPAEIYLSWNLTSGRSGSHWTENMAHLFSTYSTEMIEETLIGSLFEDNFREYGPHIISNSLDWFIKFATRVGADINVILAKAIDRVDGVWGCVSRANFENLQTYLRFHPGVNMSSRVQSVRVRPRYLALPLPPAHAKLLDCIRVRKLGENE